MTLSYGSITNSETRLALSCGGQSMNRMISGAAAALALLACFAVASAAPAAAAPATAWTPTNESYAVYAAGRLSVQPVGAATYSGGSPVVLPNADAAGLLRTGIITNRAG